MSDSLPELLTNLNDTHSDDQYTFEVKGCFLIPHTDLLVFNSISGLMTVGNDLTDKHNSRE